MKRIFVVFLVLLFFAVPVLAKDLQVSWNYETGLENVTGFKIYMSTVSGQYTADDIIATVDYNTGEATYTTGATVDGVNETVTDYYFVGTAYNDEQESDYSNEVVYHMLGSFSITIQAQ